MKIILQRTSIALLGAVILLASASSHAARTKTPRTTTVRGNTYKGSWVNRSHYFGKDQNHIVLGRRVSKVVAKKIGLTLGRDEVISLNATHEQPLPGLGFLFGQGRGGSLLLNVNVATLATSKKTGRLRRYPVAYSGGKYYTVKLGSEPKNLDDKSMLKLVVDKLTSKRSGLAGTTANAGPYQR